MQYARVRSGITEAIEVAGSSSATQPSRSSQRFTYTSRSSRQNPWSESRMTAHSSGRRRTSSPTDASTRS